MMTGSNRPRTALADGSEKLAKLARTVREQQIADMPGVLRVAVSDVYSTSPDEAWSKRFMSQGIGPVPECAADGGFCPMPFTASQASQSHAVAPAAQPQVSAYVETAVPVAPSQNFGQIGQYIGKPPKRRWWQRRSP